MRNRSTYSNQGNRLPPHDRDAENAVLGVILMAGKLPAEAQSLRPRDFYGHRHAQVWAAIQRLDASGEAIDLIAVRIAVQQVDATVSQERLAAELAALLDGGWLRSNLAYYVGLVHKFSALRQSIEASCKLIELAQSAPENLDALVAAAEQQLADLNQQSAARDAWGFPLHTWELSSDAMEEAHEVSWTIAPVMAVPDVVCLVGDGGVGKSKVAASISLSVAFGRPVLGQYTVQKPGMVVYLNEERPDLTRRHLHTIARSLGIDPAEIQERLLLFGRGRRTWLVTDVSAQRALIRRLKQLGHLALIVFDSLHVLHDAEENDNAEMTRVIEGFRRICLEVGSCGLIIHHTGKGVGGEASPSARGASAIKDSVDSQFMIRRLKSDDPSQLRIHQDKTRRALISPFVIRMEHDSRGDVLAIHLVGKPPSRSEVLLPDVIAFINGADRPLKSGEIAMKLVGKHRKEDVYAALKRIREGNLASWRMGPRGVFIYGSEVDGPA